MRLFYGTTVIAAGRIRRYGIRPTLSSPEIWLSRSLAVAQSRAHELSRLHGGGPAVIVCHVDLTQLRQQWGSECVHCRGPMVSLRGRVSAEDVVNVLPVETSPVELPADEAVLTPGEVFGLLDSPSPRVRLMGVLMLTAQRSLEGFDWLCTMLHDSDPRVRLGVVTALRQRGHDACEVLRGMARDADPAVRQAVQEALDAQLQPSA